MDHLVPRFRIRSTSGSTSLSGPTVAESCDETGLAMPAGDISEWAEALVAQVRNDGIVLTGEGGLLTGLIRQVLQTG